ncbi:hypothetical protein MMC30_004898 [Trapelia coarctata]|nr:hypothetical protein [Trapelia coarctata]
MPRGLVRQETRWICARCANSIRFWAESSAWRIPSSVRDSRPSSTLAAPPREPSSTTNNKIRRIPVGDRNWGPLPSQKKPDTKNILVDDLQATLEAHRANKARLIRKFWFNNLGSGHFFPSGAPHEETKGPIRKVGLDSIGSGNFFRLGAPHEEAKGSVRLKRHVKTPTQALQTPDPADTIQKSDAPESLSETGLAEAAFEAGSTSKAGDRVVSIPPGGPWYCLWKITSGPRFGAIQRPWLNHVQVEEVEPMLMLDEEIRAFERYMTPDPEEEASVQKLIAHVKEIVAAVAPTSQLNVHGSRYTKLAGPLSDIDFCLSLPEYEKNPLERGPSSIRRQAQVAAHRLLRNIQRALYPIAREGSVEFIGARVSLVAALDRVTGLSLQFSILAPYLPAREYTMLYLSEFPSLRALYVVLRHALHIRQLTTVHDGGLGSYPLLIMIVTALKLAGTTFERNDLGHQLLHVLDFWSNADLETNGYSAEPPQVFKKLNFDHRFTTEEREERSADPVLKGIDFIRKPGASHSWLLCLQDPGTPTNDLGRSTHDIAMVQAVFSHAHWSLSKSITRWWGRPEHQRRSFSFLESLIRAKYDDFESSREVVRQGSKVTRALPAPPMLSIRRSKEGEPVSQEASATSAVEEDPPSSSTKMAGLRTAFEEDKEQCTTDSQSESLAR